MSKEAMQRAFVAGWFGNNKSLHEAGAVEMAEVQRAFDGWYQAEIAKFDPPVKQYACNVCKSTDPTKYLRCQYAGCPDGR